MGMVDQTRNFPGGGGHPATGCVDRIGDVRRKHETVIADAGIVASEGDSYSASWKQYVQANQ